MYNENNLKDVMKLNILKKRDLLKSLKIQEDEEKIDIFKILEENSKSIKEEDLIKLKNELVFDYAYKDLAMIPTKSSVTKIVHKNIEKQNYTLEIDNEETKENLNNDETETNEKIEQTQEFQKPKFLEGTEQEKITPAKRGTLIHLCMKNLDFNKDYNLEQIQELIQDLKNKQIITSKEAQSINPNTILQFTYSKIWKELKTAKQYYKEQPFYINIPAKQVMDVNADENILVQGIIDLYYINSNNELILLDYKTDSIKKGDEQILIDRHKNQLMLYKQAIESALNQKVSQVYIYSTALGKELEVT